MNGGMVYYLCDALKKQALSVNVSSEVWHQRMGHPSDKVVRSLPFIDSRHVMSKACDVCHKSKQTRDSFPVSEKKTTRFELIHCNLWGPYAHITYGLHVVLSIF